MFWLSSGGEMRKAHCHRSGPLCYHHWQPGGDNQLHHPESLLVPALMLGQVPLARASALLSETAYTQHVKAPSYELSPLWQADRKRGRWLGWRYIAIVLLYGAVMVGICEMAPPALDVLVHFILGVLFGGIGLGIGRACGNLATFAYVRRHAGQLSGEVTMSQELAFVASASSYAPALVVLALLLVLAPTAATFGAAFGVGAITLRNLAWLLGHRSKRKEEGNAAGGPGESARS